jgi:phage portal protein BeeE
VPFVNLFQRLLGFEERSHDPLDPDATYPDIDAQLYARQRAHVSSRPQATIGEALGIPAIFRAVTLLSTVAASLQLKEYVQGREVTPAAPVIRRPQRAWTPGAFTRQTVLNMAAYGEAIWIVKERDAGGLASDLVPVKPTLLKSDFSGM